MHVLINIFPIMDGWDFKHFFTGLVQVIVLICLVNKFTYFKQTKLQSNKSCCILHLMLLLMFFGGHKEPQRFKKLLF